jgi:hypothetical protein
MVEVEDEEAGGKAKNHDAKQQTATLCSQRMLVVVSYIIRVPYG